MASKYPSNNRLHTKIRKSMPKIPKGRVVPQFFGTNSRFTTPIPQINGYNKGASTSKYF